ncbi:MAG: MFS transporter [Zoogloeaceae bacterium]|jgi:MFS family permease|nr:MFS transporter [Zoogloeaceae bacterium]
MNAVASLNAQERKVGMALAAIFGLRMLGLFLVFPVFALYARTIPGGEDMTRVGLALGAYGGTQACLQILWGAASDRWGRKPVIVAGLVLFALGSAVAALASDIDWIIAGRVIQGAGAISAAVTALAADLTRPESRTRIMAMIGASISLVFALSLVAAPILYAWIGMRGIFWLTGALSLLAIVALLKIVPPAPPPVPGERVPTRQVLFDPRLLRLNFGVFVLHFTQMALWMLVPAALATNASLALAEHWKIYLPAVLCALLLMTPLIIAAEKKGKMKAALSGAILLLIVVLLGLFQARGGALALFCWLTLFFVAFNLLEATQPSLISRIAPPAARGKAMGIYNTLQAAGLFAGGLMGGLLLEHHGEGALLGVCAALSLVWLILSLSLRIPAARLANLAHSH